MKQSTARVIAVVGSAAAAVSMFMPWLTMRRYGLGETREFDRPTEEERWTAWELRPGAEIPEGFAGVQPTFTLVALLLLAGSCLLLVGDEKSQSSYARPVVWATRIASLLGLLLGLSIQLTAAQAGWEWLRYSTDNGLTL